MSVPSAIGCPHHNSSREFSCCVQGPDKGHFLPCRPSCSWYHKQNDCSKSSRVVERVPLSYLRGTWRRAPISSLHLSLVARGEQDTVGMRAPPLGTAN